MVNNKFTGITLCIALMVLIASVLWFLDSATSRYKNVNSSWEQYSTKEAKIVELALELESSLGFGGMIHGFKNYVIRGEDSYRLLLADNISNVRLKLKSLYQYLNSSEEVEEIGRAHV